MVLDRIIQNLMIVALITLATYPITKLRSFKRTIIRVASEREKLMMGFFFGLLSILGTLTAFEVFNGIKIQSSIIGPLAGGMIGGTVIGIIASFIGVIFRLSVVNQTMTADVVSILLAGIAGGLFFHTYRRAKPRLYWVYIWALFVEAFNLIFILLTMEPRILSKVYFSMIGINLVLINPLGVLMLVSLIRDIQYNQNLIGANYAEKALEIAERTLSYFKEGYNEDIMREIAYIIYEYVGLPAVAIVGTEEERVYVGKRYSNQHHSMIDWTINGVNVQDDGLKDARFNDEKHSVISHFETYSIIRAPLWLNNDLIGELQFYKIINEIVPTDIKMIEGIASLLSLQIQNSQIYDQEKQLIKSEYSALKAQVNPHFLYNTLNVIKTTVRLNPEKAQKLIIDLGDFYRRSLSERGDLIPFIEELKLIKSYMDLQTARFGDKIDVSLEVPEEAYSIAFPTFTIQPLIENSIIHGMMDKDEHILKLKISAEISHKKLIVNVSDNGPGFSHAILDNLDNISSVKDTGIGLNNINLRLKSLYLSNYKFEISNHDNGANVMISVPIISKEMKVYD